MSTLIYKIRNVETKEFLNTSNGTFSKKAGTIFKQLSKAKENLETFRKYNFGFFDKTIVVKLELVSFELVERVIQ